MATKKQAKKVEKEGTFNEEYRDRYKEDRSVRTPSGGYSVSNRDEVAKALNGLTVEQLGRVAARAGLGDRMKRWVHLNPGMQRMNLGNVVRATTDKKKVADALAEARKLPRTAPAPAPKKSKRAKGRATPAPTAAPAT